MGPADELAFRKPKSDQGGREVEAIGHEAIVREDSAGVLGDLHVRVGGGNLHRLGADLKRPSVGTAAVGVEVDAGPDGREGPVIAVAGVENDLAVVAGADDRSQNLADVAVIVRAGGGIERDGAAVAAADVARRDAAEHGVAGIVVGGGHEHLDGLCSCWWSEPGSRHP